MFGKFLHLILWRLELFGWLSSYFFNFRLFLLIGAKLILKSDGRFKYSSILDAILIIGNIICLLRDWTIIHIVKGVERFVDVVILGEVHSSLLNLLFKVTKYIMIIEKKVYNQIFIFRFLGLTDLGRTIWGLYPLYV